MLFASETNTSNICGHAQMPGDRVHDCGKTTLDGRYRLPAATADAGKIVLGAGFRLPASTADAGKIVLGGGFRLPARSN